MDRKRPQTDDSSLKSPPGKILKTEIDDSMDISKNEDINKLITLDAPDVIYIYIFYVYLFDNLKYFKITWKLYYLHINY